MGCCATSQKGGAANGSGHRMIREKPPAEQPLRVEPQVDALDQEEEPVEEVAELPGRMPTLVEHKGIFPRRQQTVDVAKIDVLLRKRTVLPQQPAVPTPDLAGIMSEARRRTQKIAAGQPLDEHEYDSDSDLSVGEEGGKDGEEQDGALTMKISQKLSLTRLRGATQPHHLLGGDSDGEPEAPVLPPEPESHPVGWEMMQPTSEQPEVPELAIISKLAQPDREEYDGIVWRRETHIDPQFPHDDRSIFDPERGPNEQLENLQWRQARDVLGKNYRILPENDAEIDPINIKQGNLGDCYLLSALSALAEWPRRVRELFITTEPNEAGVYRLKLYLNGVATEITVDEYFPCKADGSFAFARNADNNTIWPMLIEKAYAKAFGSYQRIESGHMMESLQTLTCSYIDILDHHETPLDELWGHIKDAISKDYIILTNVHAGEASDRVKALGLVDNHAYTLIGAYEVEDKEGDEVRLLKVRNPWGHGEWEGDWSDNSDKWTPELKIQLDLKEADDGIFHISVEDFVGNFHNTTIAKCVDGAHYTFQRALMCRGDWSVAHLRFEEATAAQLLYFQPGLRFRTGLKDQDFQFDLLNMALVRVDPITGDFIWVPTNFLRKINCSCAELDLEAGDYFLFYEIELDDNQSSTEPQHSWFVIRSTRPSVRLVQVKPEPTFLANMLGSCAETAEPHEYESYPGVSRYFTLSDSGTSFGAFLYVNDHQSTLFQEALMFNILDGVVMQPHLGQRETTRFREDAFEVGLEPGQREVVILKCVGREDTKVSYRFVSRANLSVAELKGKIEAGEGGKSQQLEDHGNVKQLNIFVHSYFCQGQGIVLVKNTEEEARAELVFNFDGSENTRVRGAKGELEVAVKSRPGTEVPVVLDAVNAWDSMPVIYSFTYRLV